MTSPAGPPYRTFIISRASLLEQAKNSASSFASHCRRLTDAHGYAVLTSGLEQPMMPACSAATVHSVHRPSSAVRRSPAGQAGNQPELPNQILHPSSRSIFWKINIYRHRTGEHGPPARSLVESCLAPGPAHGPRLRVRVHSTSRDGCFHLLPSRDMPHVKVLTALECTISLASADSFVFPFGSLTQRTDHKPHGQALRRPPLVSGACAC
ncbi:hypothetical protein F5X68DRAFT_204941 [Plectosphaerella plurivora]|uniref:Uncharacterized protein n=1 Tax=Plectosphaerella plurivora TaxID=936078 RepID=A0A9P9AD34_9PEZI|nr:hypothetical protein F5X68DRAFT_204941 [Plectosphaerella plurivora]